MKSNAPRRVHNLIGIVVGGEISLNSKSERQAILIETAHERLALRRSGGPVFGDAELSQYVGKEIRCDGIVAGGTLIAEKIEVVDR